jgi:transcriptional regulator of arginine metabolism
MTADRRKRHLKILEIISTRMVRTQEELADALTAHGWEVTQSSVSRDIAALRLVKVDGAYRRPLARSMPVDPDERRVGEGVLTIETAGDALVVLHTPPGEANHVAVALDRLAWPEVVGSIAGDDTIFLAVKDSRAQRRVLRAARRLNADYA